MANELTDISGIGTAAAARLSEAGFTTIEDVAKATPDALGKVQGFGPARAMRVIATAKDLVDVDVAEPVAATAEPKAEEAAPATVEEKVEAKVEDKPEAPKVEKKTEAKAAAKPIKKADAKTDKKVDAKVEKKADTKKVEAPKVDPVVAAAATGKLATFRQPKVFFSAAALLVLAGVAAANPGAFTSMYDTLTASGPFMASETKTTVETKTVEAVRPSIIPAPVLSRSSFTVAAMISMVFSRFVVRDFRSEGTACPTPASPVPPARCPSPPARLSRRAVRRRARPCPCPRRRGTWRRARCRR